MSDRQDDASEAMREAFANAELVCALLDRHWGDSGDDADMIHDWRATLESLVYDIRKTLGEPRMKLPCGGLVPRPRT